MFLDTKIKSLFMSTEYIKCFNSFSRKSICEKSENSIETSSESNSKSNDTPSVEQTNDILKTPEFCIIETRDSVLQFENLQFKDIEINIQSRRNKIFLLMEEVRRLKIQQKIKQGDTIERDGFSIAKENFKSALPFMPSITEKTFTSYLAFFLATVTAIIVFGGIISPSLEVTLGLGGQSYKEFIKSVGLPEQLAEVDPVVASFCGGAVGVLSALFIVEANNISLHATERCFYCQGTGYLPCGQCSGNGSLIFSRIDNHNIRCRNCSGTGKVMCTSCLCTGKQLVTEHDPRLDPWN